MWEASAQPVYGIETQGKLGGLLDTYWSSLNGALIKGRNEEGFSRDCRWVLTKRCILQHACFSVDALTGESLERRESDEIGSETCRRSLRMG